VSLHVISRSRQALTLAGVIGATALTGPGPATAAADPHGRSTLDQTIALQARDGLRTPIVGPGARPLVRSSFGSVARAQSPRQRRSLAFFAHLTDAQLADEMSPARLEYQRPGGGFLGLWRPHEALGPQTFDQAVRNVNANLLSRTPDAAGARAQVQFALVTGDLSDNHQHNEVRWGVRILEGGRVDPFSGRRIHRFNRCPGASPATVRRLNRAVAARSYTGVQDHRDWPRRSRGRAAFYDPDRGGGAYAVLPRHPGLMDRAQRPFTAEGLRVPWYAARGNHDALAQGFFGARDGASAATGCRKVMSGPAARLRPGLDNPWDAMRGRLGGRAAAWVPPDPGRRFVSPRQFKRLHGRADSGHGFGLVAPGQRRRSGGAANHYAWSPAPGLRLISLDTVAEAGGPDGNIDHPQFRWLTRELRRARARDQLVIAYGHHSLETMRNQRADELAGSCRPGRLACDADPRRSLPLHLGTAGSESVRSLLLRFPNVVAYVAGHVHRSTAVPNLRPGGPSGFWQITTASHMSYPQQTRLIELMDNGDGTLSLIGTVLDTAAPVDAPPPGTPATNLTEAELGSISRLLAANVRGGRAAASAGRIPAGNVELLLLDPRRRSR